MSTPGQRLLEQSRARHEKLKFYVECLTNVERSKLAVRYLRKVPPRHRLYLLRRVTVSELGLCEVVSSETYGW